MKKTLTLILMTVIILVIGLTAGIWYSDVGQKLHLDEEQTEQTDEVQMHVDPVFFAPVNAIAHKHILQDKEYYDSVFISIPDEIINDISSILIRKEGSIVMEEIVDEYIKNKRIYDGIYENRQQISLNNNSDFAPDDKNTTNRPRDSQSISSSDSTNVINTHNTLKTNSNHE